MADADLYQFELLSLVNKITQEISNHTGYNDKTLAEFLINLHESHKSLPEFKAKLKELETGFSDSFVENVDRLILSLHPKYKKRKSKSAKAKGKAKQTDDEISEIERQKRMFPGLALKDKEVPPAVSDDIFLKELGDLVAGKTRPGSTDDEVQPPAKRQRRSPSPRGRDGRDERRDDRYGNRNGARQRQIDEKPILFKIYDGKVSGLKEFGAFVTLDGVAGRAEGMFGFRTFVMFYLT